MLGGSSSSPSGLSDDAVLATLHAAADAVRTALDGLHDWGLAGADDSQYHHDLAADAAALDVLGRAGLPVVSEESGETGGAHEIVVVLDPVDGSTNASRGIPWFNTSLCAVDAAGPWVALVVDQVHGHRFAAVRGNGATIDGRALRPSACREVGSAVIGVNGYPRRHLGWKQYRALGAAALDLCAVASGVLDAFVDCSASGLAPWDYLAGVLICQEAGASVVDLHGRELATTVHADRRSVVAASTSALLSDLFAVQNVS